MGKNNLTATSPMPKEVQEYLNCNLLHKKTPIMDGNIIKWVCMECEKEKKVSDD